MTQGKDQESRPQIYISGTLHGDEVIGPNAAYYLIEYLLSNYLTDPQVTKLQMQLYNVLNYSFTSNKRTDYHTYDECRGLFPPRKRRKTQQRTLGLYKKLWQSKRQESISIDINRDFPYNTQAEECLNTIAGRVIHQIFTQNLIVSAITFHGGTNVIGYPWGSFNRVEQEKGQYRSIIFEQARKIV